VEAATVTEGKVTELEGLLVSDLERQTKALAVALGKSIDNRAAIYLDTRYWLILRDVRRGEYGASGVELLDRLRAAVQAGCVFCPISESTIFELFKQSDPSSRAETAQLVDELSLGVAILGSRERMGTELAHFIHSHAAQPTGVELHPIRHLVWTKGAGVMGIRVPVPRRLDTQVALEIQRKFVERLWHGTTATELLAGDAAWRNDDEDDDFSGLTRQLNADVAAHKDSLATFKSALAAEIDGVVDVLGDTAMAIVVDLARRQGEEPSTQGSDAWRALRNAWCNLLAAALRKAGPRQQLRSMYVGAALHAAFRWNKGQKFDSNDLYDFEHASAALAHCQAFFTERPLWQMVTANHITLDRLFGCRVIWDLDEAIAVLADLAPGGASDV
jgi:hypothetical protein